MKLKMSFAAALLAATMMSGVASAKTFVYCSEASPEGFDPGLYTGGNTFDASAHPVYNRLLEFKKGTTETEPGLAESYEVSDDGLQYTFKLRPGVKFQTTEFFTPTREFNADDVIFSFERMWKADNPWNKYIPEGSWEYFSGMGMPDLLDKIEKVDDLTVKFTLKRKEAPFLANVAMPFASIISKEYADKLQADGKMNQMNQMPLGTGPFTFVGYQKDAVIRYKANPDYWGGKQPIDDLVFAITTDASVRYQKLKAGECHLMPYPNAADVEAMKADPDLKVAEQPGLNVAYLAYNTLLPPFDKVEVRKALNMAINKQAIVDAVFQGFGTVAKNPIPPTMWSYNDAIEDDKYDPEAAKKALEAAGVKDLSMKIWAMPVARPYMLNARRAAELMQSDLAASRRQGRDRLDGMGRVPEELLGQGSRQRRHPRLDRRQWRPGQLPRHAAGLRRRRRQQPRAVVQQGVRRSGDQGQGSQRPGRTHQALRTGPGHFQARGPLEHYRPLAVDRSDAQERRRLRPEPARRLHIRRCRHQGMTLF